MVQFKVLSGKMAGAVWVARRFPVRVGRSPACDLRIEEQGVWDHHFSIALNPATGFVVDTEPEALVTANGQLVQRTVLRNGDTIEFGGARIQFWLANARQRSLNLAEFIAWLLITTVTLSQVALVYWLVS